MDGGFPPDRPYLLVVLQWPFTPVTWVRIPPGTLHSQLIGRGCPSCPCLRGSMFGRCLGTVGLLLVAARRFAATPIGDVVKNRNAYANRTVTVEGGVTGEGAVAVCRGLVVRDDQVDLDSGRETDRVDRERLSDQGGAGSEEAGARSISVTVAAAERVGRDRNGYEDDSGRQKEVPHRRSSSIRVPGAGCARTLLALPRSRAERESVPSPN